MWSYIITHYLNRNEWFVRDNKWVAASLNDLNDGLPKDAKAFMSRLDR